MARFASALVDTVQIAPSHTISEYVPLIQAAGSGRARTPTGIISPASTFPACLWSSIYYWPLYQRVLPARAFPQPLTSWY